MGREPERGVSAKSDGLDGMSIFGQDVKLAGKMINIAMGVDLYKIVNVMKIHLPVHIFLTHTFSRPVVTCAVCV